MHPPASTPWHENGENIKGQERLMDVLLQLDRALLSTQVPGYSVRLNGAIDRLRSARIEETPIEGFGADAVRILAALDPG